MTGQTAVELYAGWNGPLGPPASFEQIRKNRLYLLGGGAVLVIMGLAGLENRPFLLFIGLSILLIGGLFEYALRKEQDLRATIYFDRNQSTAVQQAVYSFITHHGYHPRPMSRKYGLVRASGLELPHFGFQLHFHPRYPYGHRFYFTLFLREVTEANLQQAITFQIALDQYLVQLGLGGKNPEKKLTRYLWDGGRYTAMV